MPILSFDTKQRNVVFFEQTLKRLLTPDGKLSGQYKSSEKAVIGAAIPTAVFTSTFVQKRLTGYYAATNLKA